MDNWIWFHIPVGYLFAIGNPRSDWMFKTEPEEGLNGRSLNYPRGKVIGGSSAINAMIYMRGQAADYDHWRQLGLTGWGWDDVLPYFKRHEDHLLGASEAMPSAANGGSRRRACAGTARCVPRRGERSRHQADPRLQHRRQRGLVPLSRQPEARPALVGGARLPQAGARRAPICGSRPDAWSERIEFDGTRAVRRALAAETAQRGRRDARRRGGHPRRRFDRLDPAAAALRRRACRRARASSAFRSCSTSRASARTCRIICSSGSIYKVSGVEDAQRDLALAARPRAHGARLRAAAAAARSPWRLRNSGCSPARTRRASAPISSSTCSRCRSTSSATRCTRSRP